LSSFWLAAIKEWLVLSHLLMGYEVDKKSASPHDRVGRIPVLTVMTFRPGESRAEPYW
jgi:hypothetical protein